MITLENIFQKIWNRFHFRRRVRVLLSRICCNSIFSKKIGKKRKIERNINKWTLFVSNKNFKLSLSDQNFSFSARQTMDVDDGIKTRDSQIYLSFEDENQDRRAFLTSVPAHSDLRTYYTSRDTQWTNPFYTQESAGHQFTLECPLTVLSICNLRPRGEWELFTVPIRYPRYLQPMSVHEVNSKVDNQTLIQYFYTRFDKIICLKKLLRFFFFFFFW